MREMEPKDPGWFADFHTHTLLSDGELLPSELVQRVKKKGCRCIAITDHVDGCNLELVLGRLGRFMEEVGEEWGIQVIPGVELTHVPPTRLERMVERARGMGAKWVVVHGETLVEPVAKGTNRAGIEAGADLIAHPGLIDPRDAELAARNGVFLEITTRRGHSLSNGWVLRRAMEAGARLLINTDTHSPGDILEPVERARILKASGMGDGEVERVWQNALEIMRSFSRK